MKIETLIGIENYTLLIYSYARSLYRFDIIDSAGITFGFDSIFSDYKAAYESGKNAIKLAFELEGDEY